MGRYSRGLGTNFVTDDTFFTPEFRVYYLANIYAGIAIFFNVCPADLDIVCRGSFSHLQPNGLC